MNVNATQTSGQPSAAVEKTTASPTTPQQESKSTIEDIRRHAKVQQTSMDRYRDVLLIESKCRKIYTNWMVGKRVIGRDRYYLLKNKPELYGIAKAMAKKPEGRQRLEKVLKHYKETLETHPNDPSNIEKYV